MNTVNTVNAISLLIAVAIVVAFFYYIIKKFKEHEKRLKFESIRDNHALVRAEMHRLFIEFNDKYTSWMFLKSRTDQTPMGLLYKEQYNDLVRYEKNWINHVHKEYEKEISPYI